MKKNPQQAFKLKDLNHMYIDELQQIGLDENPHTSRFCEKLKLLASGCLNEKVISKKLHLFFDSTLVLALQEQMRTPDELVKAMRKVVGPLRKMIFDHTSTSEEISFSETSQIDSVPAPLLTLMNMLIGSKHIDTSKCSQVSLTAAQLIQSNAHSLTISSEGNIRFDQRRETPLKQYITMKIYTSTGSRILIDSLYKLGLCVSYYRLLDITKDIYDGVRKSYMKYKIFSPNILETGLFTVTAKDNVDKNARSNFVTSLFHGTSITILQHKKESNHGESLPPVQTSSEHLQSKSRKLPPLPEEYSQLQSFCLTRKIIKLFGLHYAQ